jgi:decaprenylphospho-beta-D-ribofuranose 2-oxidase
MLHGWGRFPRARCQVATPADAQQLAASLGNGSSIARGMGRSYGDSALNPRAVVDCTRLSHFLAFDAATGVLEAEAGAVLGDIITSFLPRGWFPPVTPGSRFVTLGGMIAADVHGKNHHVAGSIGSHILWLDLMAPDGSVHRCSRDQHAELFALTIGGMGLTGPILRAAVRLMPVASGWIKQRQIAAPDLDAAIAAFEDTLASPYSVAWIDCLATGTSLGRSLITLGSHAALADLPEAARARPFDLPVRRRLNVPIDAPGWALNGLSVRLFNALYHARGLRALGDSVVGWDSYFYPLDAILNWNRIYGRQGFAQFQCVLPLATSRAGLVQLLETISAAGTGSFLAVLKRMGPQESRLSFPMEGYTLALDFPARPAPLALLEQLDRIVLDHGGRFYLAKDSRMPAAVLHASDPRAAAFRARREALGLVPHFSSLQSERLGL